MKTEHFRQPLSLMRFLAVILITNSHIGPLYPPHLQFLSTGGALGNSLFFFCSGFALYLSNRDTGFAPWAIRRFYKNLPQFMDIHDSCVSSEGYSLSVCRTLLFLPFGSCKPSLCSMFSSSIPSSFLKGSCGKSVSPLSFRYSSPISMCPIMNGLSKTPNTTTFYIGIFITSLCCLEPSPPNGGQIQKALLPSPDRCRLSY